MFIIYEEIIFRFWLHILLLGQQIKIKIMKYSSVLIFLFVYVQLHALNPVRTYSVNPSDFGMNYQEIKIPSEEGIMLNAWYFPSSKTSYKIMVLSDDGNGNMADLMEQVSVFLSLGYHVLAYDYRGYGASSDFEIKPKFYI